MIHLGVAGTRRPLTDQQWHWLKDEMAMADLSIRLVKLQRPLLHHGDCTGGDAAAHEIAVAMGWHVIIHPPVNDAYRAYCQVPQDGVSKILREQKYRVRDERIAIRSSLILGIPGTPLRLATKGGRKQTSGTWGTLLMAMELGKEVKICSIGVT